MTKEEAINTFKEWIERDKKMEYADRLENIEIYNMAIKALEEQEFKITPEEVEKLKKVANEAEKITKGAKCLMPNTKSCSYLLPCGMCNKTNQKCNLVNI